MNKTPDHKPRPLIDLLVSIILPSIILMKFSGENDLGSTGGLVTALAFPLGWGIFELIKYRKFNFIALLGLISVLLTGGIGLFELDTKWLAIKEAAVPSIIGLVVLGSTFTRFPLVKTLLFNPKVINVDKIKQRLEEKNSMAAFENRMMKANYLFAGTFVFSAIMNFILAKWIVTSPTGSAAFNEELGQLTLYSYPMIAIPSTIMLMAILYYLWRTIHGLTGLGFEDILAQNHTEK